MISYGWIGIGLSSLLYFLVGTEISNKKQQWMCGVGIVIASILLIQGMDLVQHDYAGKFCEDYGETSLKTNEVYETLSAVEEKDGVFVVLRTREGKHLAYKLAIMPPKVFKRRVGRSQSGDTIIGYNQYP